jgi:sporulation protein YlmC with PRC-barrel domain
MNFQTERIIENTIKDYGKIEFTVVDQETGVDQNLVIENDNWEFVKSEIEGYENGYDVYI